VIQLVVTVVVTAALLEGLVAWSFRYPRVSPLPAALVRYLHIRFDRQVIQVMPECARYDSTLTYTLKPGHCVFASREFSNTYAINSLGVRDDEDSLHAPQTVMLGDSLTMGWGVEQDQSFPSVFERLSGQRTLNAGVSSYGTVRELRMLGRVDRSAVKNIVIQYNDNDTGENRQLIERPPFTTLSQQQYERTVAEQATLLRYYPGKYAFNVMVQLQSALRRSSTEAPVTPVRQAELFVRVIEHSPVDLSSFRLIALAVNGPFIDAAKTVAAKSSLPWVTRIEFIDATPALRDVPNAYYGLDDHPRAASHEAIGKLLNTHLSTYD